MPEPLTKAELSKAVRSEIESTYRVYEKSWAIAVRLPTVAYAQKYFNDKYDGRIYAEDMNVSLDPEDSTWVLSLRRWTVLAEWKSEALARKHMLLLLEEDPDREVEVVARNSRREHVLNDYGKLKLPTHVVVDD